MALSHSKFERNGRQWARRAIKACDVTLQRLSTVADACLEGGVRFLLDAFSRIASKLPTALKQWFHLSIFSVFDSRPLRATLPLFVVGTIIGMLYVGFVNIYLPFTGHSLLSPLSLCFHGLLLLAITSYYKGVVTDPGEIPDSWTVRPHVSSRMVEKKKSSGDFRWCQKEKKFKPDRAHYCTPMSRNVLRMDHYCPWLSTCVGYYNHKYFFLFLLYTTISTNMVGFGLGHLLLSPATLSAGHVFFAWEVECLAALLSVVLTPFFGFHCWLLSHNMTTIEFCEKRRDHLEARSPYDINVYHNMKCVLGSNPFAWFLPVDGGLGDGMTFDVHAGCDEPERTCAPTQRRCWSELWGDVHKACNDCHGITLDTASRFYSLFAGGK